MHIFPHSVPVPVILLIRFFFSTELEGKYTEHSLHALHQTLQSSGLPVELAKAQHCFQHGRKGALRAGQLVRRRCC